MIAEEKLARVDGGQDCNNLTISHSPTEGMTFLLFIPSTES